MHTHTRLRCGPAAILHKRCRYTVQQNKHKHTHTYTHTHSWVHLCYNARQSTRQPQPIDVDLQEDSLLCSVCECNRGDWAGYLCCAEGAAGPDARAAAACGPSPSARVPRDCMMRCLRLSTFMLRIPPPPMVPSRSPTASCNSGSRNN